MPIMKVIKNIAYKIHSPVTHLVLYGLLLIFTPFIMLHSYLQLAVGKLSDYSVYPFGFRLPLMFTCSVTVSAILLIVFRRKLTLFRVAAGTVCLLMLALGWWLTDFYIIDSFYDLQSNWHYIAYGLFSMFFYRAFNTGRISTSRIIMLTYLSALGLSIFDEGFQLFLSSRVFDINDIAKDSWGTMIGLIVLYFVIDQGRTIGRYGWVVRQDSLGDYLKKPWPLLVLELLVGLLLLVFSSVFSDLCNLICVVFFTSCIFGGMLFILHLWRHRAVRVSVCATMAVVLLIQGGLVIRYRNQNIVYNTCGLTIYRGLILPFFDLMIFPDNTFRVVDRKRAFLPGDIGFFLSLKPDVLVIGTGAQGQGGFGFGLEKSQLIFNKNTGRCTHVILLPTPGACDVFNSLKEKGKRNVMFVLHNT